MEIQGYKDTKITAFITHQVVTCLQGVPILHNLTSKQKYIKSSNELV